MLLGAVAVQVPWTAARIHDGNERVLPLQDVSGGDDAGSGGHPHRVGRQHRRCVHATTPPSPHGATPLLAAAYPGSLQGMGFAFARCVAEYPCVHPFARILGPSPPSDAQRQVEDRRRSHAPWSTPAQWVGLAVRLRAHESHRAANQRRVEVRTTDARRRAWPVCEFLLPFTPG